MKTDTDKVIDKWMKAPPRTWDVMASNLPLGDAIAGAMNDDATRLAMMAAYISHRHAGRDHNTAVKAMNLRRKQVRRVLGYSYPASGELKI